MRLSILAAGLFALAIHDTAHATSRVAEVETVRLDDGADAADFDHATGGLTPFLATTDARNSRTLSVCETGLWIGQVTWTAMATACQATEAMIKGPEGNPFLALVDRHRITMHQATIHPSKPRE